MSLRAGLEAFVRAELARHHDEPEQLQARRPRRTRGARRLSRPAVEPSAAERGLTDMGREASAAAGMPLAAAPRPVTFGAIGAAVRCDRCGLIVASRTAALAPRYCPRCLARQRTAVRLRPFQLPCE